MVHPRRRIAGEAERAQAVGCISAADAEDGMGYLDGTLAKSDEYTGAYEMVLVNQIRQRVAAWRKAGYPGATRTTLELLQYWRREGRERRLFFAQCEAAETVIFLLEARADFRQGISVPLDEPSSAQQSGRDQGVSALCMQDGDWQREETYGDARGLVDFEQSERPQRCTIFRCRADCVPERTTVTTRRSESGGGRSERLPHTRPGSGESNADAAAGARAGDELAQLSTAGHAGWRQGGQDRTCRTDRGKRVNIGPKTTTARGSRYLSAADLEQQIGTGQIAVIAGTEKRDQNGTLKSVEIEAIRYRESDAAWVRRLFEKEFGGKQNILVLNDEAHHAYRIRVDEQLEDEDDDDGDYEKTETTVWVEGLDRLHRHRGINFCVELSATPYFLGRVGQDANRPFPWVVSDFGLVDAIESGLVKIPQLAVRDTTGAAIPHYFHVWDWIMTQLTAAERGGKKGSPKPEAVLKYAHTPIAMLGGLWEEKRREWEAGDDPRPPVFIIVCKNTKIARVIYEWLAEDRCPLGIPSAHIEGFRNRDGEIRTIHVDSKVVHETDSGEAKSDEARWMRYTLDMVGKLEWPLDSQRSPIHPEGFRLLAEKLKRPLHPPGRDIRCIVSVGMLTEGWDCNTVTHIVGLRPFMSQLLCEQVVGRGLRRRSYDLTGEGKFEEEVAKVFGVPFEVIPFKADPKGGSKPREKRYHVHAVPEKAGFEIRFPRVEGYTRAIRNRISLDWSSITELQLMPGRIPTDVEMKASLPNNAGRVSLAGPGRLESVDLNPYRSGRRFQELVFEMAAALTRDYSGFA